MALAWERVECEFPQQGVQHLELILQGAQQGKKDEVGDQGCWVQMNNFVCPWSSCLDFRGVRANLGWNCLDIGPSCPHFGGWMLAGSFFSSLRALT